MSTIFNVGTQHTNLICLLTDILTFFFLSISVY